MFAPGARGGPADEKVWGSGDEVEANPWSWCGSWCKRNIDNDNDIIDKNDDDKSDFCFHENRDVGDFDHDGDRVLKTIAPVVIFMLNLKLKVDGNNWIAGSSDCLTSSQSDALHLRNPGRKKIFEVFGSS